MKLWRIERLIFITLFATISISYAQFDGDSDYGNIAQTEYNMMNDNLEYPNATLTDDPISPSKKIIDDSGYHFGVWVNYQQQFGALEDKLLTIGGPSFGFNLGRYFFIGGGVYSSFGNLELSGSNHHSLVYGGGIVGFRWNPSSPVVFRTQVLVGAIGFDTISRKTPGLVENRETSVIVVPEIALDIRLVGHLYLSLSANYHYVEKLPEAWKDFQGLGALSGAVSLGLSF
ncbi:MAG: hypothetical protein ACRCWI_05185 [Brevinema sp.]